MVRWYPGQMWGGVCRARFRRERLEIVIKTAIRILNNLSGLYQMFHVNSDVQLFRSRSCCLFRWPILVSSTRTSFIGCVLHACVCEAYVCLCICMQYFYVHLYSYVQLCLYTHNHTHTHTHTHIHTRTHTHANAVTMAGRGIAGLTR